MQDNISSQIQQLESIFNSSLQPSQFNHQNQNEKSQDHKIQMKNLVSNMQTIQKIFVNSLKLNQKLYTSITQKQANISLGNVTFIDTSTRIDCKIQDALKKTKQLYEDTVNQNIKARFLLEQFIRPIRQELRSKINETTFTLQMKMLLDQYDSMGHRITYDNEEQKRVQDQNKKSVNSQTLAFLRDRILPVISDIQARLSLSITKSQTSSTQIQQLRQKQQFIENQILAQNENLKEIQAKTMQRLNEKFSDSYIQKRMRESLKSFVAQFRQQVNDSVQKVDRSSKNSLYTLTTQLATLKQGVSSFIDSQTTSKIYLKLHLEKQAKGLQEHSKLLQSQSSQISGLIQKLKQVEKSNDSFKKLQTTLQNLQNKVQRGQFRSQQDSKPEQLQDLIKKLINFDVQVKRIKQFQKTVQEKISHQKGQIHGIRDILSKKANFSDILHHIQNKVDKKQFKQLKQKIQYNERDFHCQSKPHLIIKQTDLGQSHRKGKHIRSRSFFSPSSAQKIGQSQNQGEQLKRFQLGFTNQLVVGGQIGKRQYSKTQHIRGSIMDNSSYFNQKMGKFNP